MTRTWIASAAAVAVVSLASCAVKQPQTAEEFRKVAPGAMFMKTETYEVNRALRDVASTFQRRAPECLKVTVRTVSQTTGSYQNIVTQYTPTVVVVGERAELHVQQLHKTGVLYPSKPPEGGVYIFVADAYPEGGKRTRIQIYGPSKGYDVLHRAVRGWATGENMGCPDMTKIG